MFPRSQWDVRDYVLYAAREYGLRVIMTLTDNCASSLLALALPAQS